MAEVEVNVVMGAQLRAIVRSALLHVRNRVDEVTNDRWSLDEIDAELEKWPLSADPEDTLPQWLLNRFGKFMEPLDVDETADEWETLSESSKKWWEHEANAVRRAVGRGGFKKTDPLADVPLMPDGSVLSTPINQLHQAEQGNTTGQVKGVVDLNLKETESLGEAIRVAVGAASACWTQLSGAGIFDSDRALDIAAQLEHHFHSLMVLMNGQILQRHQALGERLSEYNAAGVPMVAVTQVRDILIGRATPEEYKTALQARPGTEDNG